MEQNKLFRKAAIDKLASPEQLDLLMQVTSPKGWLAIWTVGGILLGVVLWSIIGSVPTRVDGEGILIRGASLREIKATTSGVMTDLAIRLNEILAPGQVIGAISVTGLDETIETAQSEYERAEQEYAVGKLEDNATIDGHRANIQRNRVQLSKVDQELEVKRQSLEKGIITKQPVLALEREQASLRATITQIEAQIRAVEQGIRRRRLNADAAKRRVAELTATGKDSSQLKSPVTGRVIELKKKTGDSVAAGEVIAVLEPLSAQMQPVVYVPSTLGGRIKKGMEAQVSPSTVKREEYGYMKGMVSVVGEYPVTPDAALSVVANSALVQELLGNSAKIELRASLLKMEETPSGYAWSSSNGPPFQIASGTRVTVSVVVDRKAPITYVLPIIRSTLGLS